MATGTPLDITQEIKIDVSRLVPLTFASRLILASLLVVQHSNVRDLATRFETIASSLSPDDQQQQQKIAIVNTLVREIVVHLEASEMTLYNVLREKGMMAGALEEDQSSFLCALLSSSHFSPLLDNRS